ncbi:hypothetical protein [Sporosalibacterium faouarense]|uniref:hypothetical protein n=1 Tax=Sporosalibacterium faouarense TaxID=516123 RepID=UPI00192B6CB7|nr:hypothetical protein [Sporosalibacterium faouarense]
MFGEKHSAAIDYKITFPDNDFNKNYLIITGGREMKKLTYKRLSKFYLPYKENFYVGKAVLKGEIYPHTIFVYKIDKLLIKYDDISWPKVRIED